MATQKQYIGSAKPAQHNSLTVTIRMDEAEKHAYTTENGRFFTFVVSPRQEEKYGKTHTAFVMVDVPEEAPAEVAEPELALETPTDEAAKGDKPAKAGRRSRKSSTKK